jgi:hypothetical protein
MCVFICMTISLFTDLTQNITVKDLCTTYLILHINVFELSCNFLQNFFKKMLNTHERIKTDLK